MIRLDLQFFGGRGSGGGNAKKSAEATANKGSAISGPKNTLTTDERNARELARAKREDYGLNPSSLKKGETYEVKWGKGTREGAYVRGEAINGDAVRIFRDTKTGKLFQVDNDSVRNDVRAVKKRKLKK